MEIIWQLNQDIQITKEGRRIYFQFPFNRRVLEGLKGMRARWEPETKRWWMGTTSRNLDRALEYFKEEMEQAYGQVSATPQVYYEASPEIKIIEQARRFDFQFPYDKGLMQELKRLRARWDGGRKVWYLNKGEPTLEEAFDTFHEHSQRLLQKQKELEEYRLEFGRRLQRGLGMRLHYDYGDLASAKGAYWDKDRKQWLFPDERAKQEVLEEINEIKEKARKEREERELNKIREEAERHLGRAVSPTELKRINFSGPSQASKPSVGRVTRHQGELFEIVAVGRVEYIDEGRSFGFGFDDGYLWPAWVVPATQKKKDEILRQEQEERNRLQARRDAEQLGRIIKERGEFPDTLHKINAERKAILNPDNIIYGGGQWFYIEGTRYIWYVQNNGADGDRWDMNNVMTGGAGALGWRVPYEEELAEEIEALHKVLSRSRIASKVIRRYLGKR